MYGLTNLALSVLMIHGILAAHLKRATTGDNHPDNKIPVFINSITTKLERNGEVLGKHKDEPWIAENEIYPVRKEKEGEASSHVTTTTMTTTLTSSTTKPDVKDTLSDWIAAIPSNIFNIKNRIRLATVFLEARSKDDVMKKLARVTGRFRHGRRHLSRGRKISHRWPVPYHPTVRFMMLRGTRQGHN